MAMSFAFERGCKGAGKYRGARIFAGGEASSSALAKCLRASA
jgi:hypothetical protein